MNNLIKEARELAGKATPGPWQESYFVDKPRYADWSVTQKEYANKYESLAVRGPGVVGSSDCNRVFAFQPDVLPEDKAFVIRSRTLVPELADALEKAQGEIKRLNDGWYASTKMAEKYSARADKADEQYKREVILIGEYAQRVIDLTARAEKAEAELKSEKSNTEGMRSNWYKCIETLKATQSELSAYKEANPPRVHGEWIERPFLLGTSWFCSQCGYQYGMPHEMYNCCPNCGADMRKGKPSERI